MAIVQISRIQHRRGKATDLPQLAAGEFAFFPWTGAAGIVAFSASGTPYLEYAIFEA